MISRLAPMLLCLALLPGCGKKPAKSPPKAETPKAETPKAVAPDEETPGAETPRSETPGAETPEAPEAEPPPGMVLERGATSVRELVAGGVIQSVGAAPPSQAPAPQDPASGSAGAAAGIEMPNAQAPDEPPPAEAAAFTLPVNLVAGVNAAAANFTVSYDPAVVRYLGARPGPAAVAASKEVGSNLTQPGVLRVIIFGMNQFEMSASQGPAALLDFQAIDPGSDVSAAIRISNLSVADAQGRAVHGGS